jgi:hypothetical protein
MQRLAFAALAVLIAGAAPALAQPTTESDELIVTGERLREIVREFVEDATIAAPSENQLSRWHRRICPGVIGIRASYGQFIADRIAQRAHGLGLRAEAPGCRANIVVFVTPDAGRLAREFVTQFEGMVVGGTENNAHTLGAEALQDFVESDRPVRWWHVSRTAMADANLPMGDLQSVDPEPNTRDMLAEHGGRRVNGTRLERTTRQDLFRAIVIVDARAAEGLRFDALADYVAMVALAQLDPAAEGVAVPSILNLFADHAAGRAPPEGLTDWDLAYLDGLYGMTRNANSVRTQERQIIRRMERQVSAPAQQPAPIEAPGGR